MGTKRRNYLIFRYLIMIVLLGFWAAYLCRTSGVLSVICLLFCVGMAVILIVYHMRTVRKIRRVTESIEKLARREYDINLDDMVEGELAILQTAVYKTAVHLKEQAENAQKDKESVKNALSDISHQLKTPLTAMSILVENMMNDPEMETEVRSDFLKTIHHSIIHISMLVQSLLKLSRFEAKAVEFHRKPCRIGRLIESAVANVDVLSDLKSVQIKSVGDLEQVVCCDAYWQTEALTNILKNCIEHMSEDNEPNHILIEVERSAVFTKIRIKDNGSGISKEEIDHVFERFYRGKNSAPDAAGIGLALAKSIVEADGGRIRVDADGNGTSFEILFNSLYSDTASD